MNETLTFQTLDSKLGSHAPFLISLSDGLQEELRVTIAGAEVGELGDNIPDLNETDEATRQALSEILGQTRPIEFNEKCLYEICFHDYILYQIRNESYSTYAPEEVGQGRYLIIFEKSILLSNLPNMTDAQVLDDGSYYPGKWTHYGICTQNHIIDVIALTAPDISVMRRD